MTAVRIRLASGFVENSVVSEGVSRCWFDVSNAGGAVGFPFPPVSIAQVRRAAELLSRDVAAGSAVVFIAEIGDEVVGWVSLRFNRSELTQHWASVERLQSRPDRRGLGVGRQLMESVVEHAVSIGLEQLRLMLRGGEGLESFYAGLGWSEIGRHPGALRLSRDDDRDEVSMLLELSCD